MSGLGIAAHKLELVVFTTLGPSGALAFALLCALAYATPRADDARRGIEKACGVPLIVALTGLIASAAQLGTPSNALYVLAAWDTAPFRTK